MPLLKFSDVPGLAEAIRRENNIRDASFLDLTTSICGVEIRQMTPRDWLILEGVGNPLMLGRMPTPEQLAQFLWILSPNYRTDARFRRYLFGRKIRKVNFVTAVKACWKYIEETFQDSPGGSNEHSTPYAGWCAYVINRVAINYGWSDEVILGTPLKRLFQYLKCIARHHDPRTPMHNPSDKVKGDYIRMLNARTQLINVLKRRLN